MKPRPSSLPKLALCGQFEGRPGTSDAAARGTRVDTLMRHLWQTGEYLDGAEDEQRLANWAAGTLLKLSKGKGGVTTDDIACKVYVPLLGMAGTMDAVCPSQRWLADLKTGQRHNYREQMAAYALGCMVAHMELEWTAHLLFADQDEVVSETFTFDEARAVVQAALDNVGKPPVINDYCQWCAKSLTCPVRVDDAGKAMTATASALPVEQDTGFLAMIEDPERLGLFLTRCQTFDDFREAAEAKARELLAAGQAVPGWRLQKPRSSEFVDGAVIVAAVEEGTIGLVDVIKTVGSISGRKARELWNAAGAVFPESVVQTKTGAAPLVAIKLKK